MWRIAALAGVVALFVAGCSGISIPADHRAAAKGLRPGPAKGPDPGILRELWRIDAGRASLGVEIEGGHVITVDSAGVVAYDVATGRKRWSYREPRRAIETYATTENTIVISTTSGEDAEDPIDQIVALDAGTGRLLWQTAGAPTDMARLGTTGRGVVVTEDSEVDATELAGIDARTGETAWTRTLEPECGDSSSLLTGQEDDDGSLVLAQEACDDDRVRVHALDPVDGRVRWIHTRPDRDFSVSVAAGAAAFVDQDDMDRLEATLIGRNGRPMAASGQMDKCIRCRLVAAGDRVVWPSLDPRSQPRYGLIDVRSGRFRSIPMQSQAHETFGTPDGRAYGLRAAPGSGVESGPGIPAAWLDIVDTRSGTVSTQPVPVTPHGTVRVAGAAGGRLVLATGGEDQEKPAGIAAYGSASGTEAVELGGVPYKEWPKCAPLLAAVPGKRREHDPDGVVADPQFKAGSTRIPRETCIAGLEKSGDVHLDVLWVAATPAIADSLLDGEKGDPSGPDEVVTPGDEDRDTTYHQRYLRVGRVTMKVVATDEEYLPEIMRALAEKVRSDKG